MEIYSIPFEDQFIVYRPLLRLAFVGNSAMAEYALADRSARPRRPASAADKFLRKIGFDSADPEPPSPWVPSNEHRPTTAVLLMTSACNLRCSYCYARAGEHTRQDMNENLARKVVDTCYENAKSLGRDRFELAFHGGGEPTVNWKVLRSTVDYARGKDLPCEITMATNGMWSERRRQFILENFTGLSLSLDGVREVQDAQRPMTDGRGSFDKVMGAVHALDEAGLPYGIRMTATTESFARLPESMEFLCSETNCQVFQVEPCYTSSRGEYGDLTASEANSFVRGFLEAFQLTAAAGRTLFYSGARPWVLASSFCRAPEDALVVTPEGDVVTCFETHDRRHPLTESFRIGSATPTEVRIDPAALRKFADGQNARRAKCQGCFCYRHCGGDCALRCASTLDTDRTRCWINREITRELLAWYIAAGDGVWNGA
ncbi:MAG: radical SAM protein [Armatimonadota bacterium]|nr:radical SAM protein [Armatimonadota bacterium]